MPVTLMAATPRFQLGQLAATTGALAAFTPEEVAQSVQRHAQGDWGEICKSDAAQNQRALKHGGRLMSVYTYGGKTLWIITESDRSVTTLLLPDEY
jgi:hypothetical protein